MKKTTLICILMSLCIAGTVNALSIPANGLVAHYALDGNADDRLSDNTGTVYGATLTTDRFGNPNSAYSFDGNGDYIDLGRSPAFNFGTGDFTISIQAYLTGPLDRYEAFLGEWGGARGELGNWMMHPFSDGRVSFAFDNPSDGDSHTHLYGNKNFTLNNWHVFTATRSGSQVSFYVDDVKSSVVGIGQDVQFNIEDNLFIGWAGGNSLSTNYQIQGMLDNLLMYDRALSDTEVNQIVYATSNNPVGSNPIPEPTTMLLFGFGLIGLAGIGRRKTGNI